MGGKDLEDGKASNKSEENSYHLQPKHSGVNPVPEIMKSHKDHICHPLRLGRAACLALLGGLSVVSCTTVPQHEFQTYRRAFDEARVQSEHVLADYAAARQLKSNLVVQGNLKANTSANARLLASRLGLDTFDATSAIRQDAIEVRLKAWDVIETYNEALAAVASGAKASEIEGAVNGFLGSLQQFPLEEVAKMAGDAVPYVGVVTTLIGLVQKQVEARRFRQAVLKAELPMKQFVGLLRQDAVLFRNYRVTLLNERFVEQEILIFDRADRFRIITTSHGWNPPDDVNALVKQMNSNRVLAAGVETFPEIPQVATNPPPPSSVDSQLIELRSLADAIEREVGEARGTVVELSAYHELMRQYVLLITELERTLGVLSEAARNSTGRIPSVAQLQQVISGVRLAREIYSETK